MLSGEGDGLLLESQAAYPPHSQGQEGAQDPESQGLQTAATGRSTMSSTHLLSGSPFPHRSHEGQEEGVSSPSQL